MDNNNYYILNGQTVIDGWEDLVCKNVELANTSVEVITDDNDTMPRTKEAAIDYLNEIGWLQEHDKILSPKEGNWIKSDKYKGYSVCSVCHDCYIDSSWISPGKWLFCPSCGAHMNYKENIKKPDFTNQSGQLTSQDCYPN